MNSATYHPCLSCYMRFFIPFLLTCCSSAAAAVDFIQTIPEDGLACPNDPLQFTCTSSGNTLLFQVDGFSDPEQFTESNSVNDSVNFGDFVVVLVVQNETISIISATITNERVMSTDDGTSITCAGGSFLIERTVTIADGPANCSSMSVVPVCQITTNAGNDSETPILITLSTSESLMCVVGYLIQFNEKNKTVPVSSPSAEFPITITQGEPLDNEIIVYTLDYENRTGQMPCVFSSTELSVVNKFDYVSECDPSLNLIVTFHWMEPSVLGACSISDMPLQYMYSIEFNNSQFTNNSTRNTSYRLMGVPQGTVLEITITPTLPSQELIGPPLFRTVTLVDISCTTSSSSPSPTPLQSPGGGSQNITVILSVLASVGVIVAVVVLIVLLVLLVCKKKKIGVYKCNQSNTSGTKPSGSAHDTSEVQLLNKSIDPGVRKTGETKGDGDVLILRHGNACTSTPGTPSKQAQDTGGNTVSNPLYDVALVQETGNGSNQTADPPIARPLDSSFPREEEEEEEEEEAIDNVQEPQQSAPPGCIQSAVPPVELSRTASEKERIEQLEDKLRKETERRHQEEKEKENLQKKLVEMEEKMGQLQALLEKAEGETAQEKSKKSQLKRQLDQLRDQCERQTRRIAELDKEIKARDECIGKLTTKVENLEKKDAQRDKTEQETRMRLETLENKCMFLPQQYSGTGRNASGTTGAVSEPIEATCKGDEKRIGDDSAFESGMGTDLERDHGQNESRNPPPYGSSSGLAPSEEDTNPPNNGGDAVLLLPSRSPLPINHREQAGNGAETNRFTYDYSQPELNLNKSNTVRDEMVGHLSSNTNRSPTRHVTTSSTYRKL